MMGKRYLGSVWPGDEWESFPGGDWEDSIVVGSIKRNKDGSITIHCQIDVHGDGNSWGVAGKVIRLPKRKRG